MAISLVQYLAKPSFENLTQGIKNCQNRFEILLNTKLTLSNIAKRRSNWPNWQNFAKSGHAAGKAAVLPYDLQNLSLSAAKASNLKQ